MKTSKKSNLSFVIKMCVLIAVALLGNFGTVSTNIRQAMQDYNLQNSRTTLKMIDQNTMVDFQKTRANKNFTLQANQ